MQRRITHSTDKILILGLYFPNLLLTMAESLNHKDCQPLPVDVKEVLEKGWYCDKNIFPLIRKYFILSGPKGPDGKSLRKLIDYFTSKDPHYVVEIRPNKRSQGKELGGL